MLIRCQRPKVSAFVSCYLLEEAAMQTMDSQSVDDDLSDRVQPSMISKSNGPPGSCSHSFFPFELVYLINLNRLCRSPQGVIAPPPSPVPQLLARAFIFPGARGLSLVWFPLHYRLLTNSIQVLSLIQDARCISFPSVCFDPCWSFCGLSP